MEQTVEAIYRNGVIEPLEQLDLPESQRLRVTVEVMEERDKQVRDQYERAVTEEEERQARDQYEQAVAILRRRGTRRLTPEEAERLFGPLHPVDREAAERAFAKLGGKLSEEIIRDRGDY